MRLLPAGGNRKVAVDGRNVFVRPDPERDVGDTYGGCQPPVEANTTTTEKPTLFDEMGQKSVVEEDTA
jgi:hypothetical protein